MIIKTAKTSIPDEAIRQMFTDLLRDGHCIRSPARAESMSPFIRQGDFLTVKPITFAEAQIGDIVAYRRDETESVLTTHRVVQKGRDGEGPYLITKGDRSRLLRIYRLSARPTCMARS